MRRFPPLASCLPVAGCLAWAILIRSAAAAPSLTSAQLGTLELVTPLPEVQLLLDEVDGLAFDKYGNLIAALEIEGEMGGVAYIDKMTGTATVLVRGISRADQIEFDAHGNLFVSSEIGPASTTDRIWQVSIDYDALNKPISASKVSLQTSLAITDPEGVIALNLASEYGVAGDLLISEDVFNGRILRIAAGGATTIIRSNLANPEGMAFGRFTGDAAPALYVAETATDRVLRIGGDGSAQPVASFAAVMPTRPDNVEFGPDGYLYVSEDRPEPFSRIIRTNHLGDAGVLATGFAQAQGMVFDPTSGDMYISEHELDRVWRVRFANPLPGDFNRNGTVDAADYVVWRRSDGSPQGYQTWRENFGRRSAENSWMQFAVPEPAGYFLFVTAAIVGFCCRKRVG